MGQTTNLEFTTLNPTDLGGYTSINTCISSIDASLSSRVNVPSMLMLFPRYWVQAAPLTGVWDLTNLGVGNTIANTVGYFNSGGKFPDGWTIVTSVQGATVGSTVALTAPSGLVYISKAALT
jgi:hypothetical protein